MSGDRSVYGTLSNSGGSTDDLMSSPPGQDNDTADVYNLMSLRPQKSSGSTPSPTRRNASKPRRSPPLYGQPFILDDTPRSFPVPDDTSRPYRGQELSGGPSSSRDAFIPGFKLDSTSLKVNNTTYQLQHDFNAAKQLRRLLWRGFVRFSCTLVAAILLTLTIFVFSRKSVINNTRKKWFNAISTGLSLTLGISIAHGYKAMAIDLRWWMLSQHRRSLSEVDKILRTESLTVVWKLLCTSWSKNGNKRWYNPFGWRCRWKLLFASALWLLLNLGAQVAVALVALNYSVDNDQTFALLPLGDVLVANMTEVTPLGFGAAPQDLPGAQQYTANNYGKMALTLEASYSTAIPIPGILYMGDSGYPDFYLADDIRSWNYVFLDWAPPRGNANTPVYTNRRVNSTWSCNSYPVIQGGNGTVLNLTIALDTNSDKYSVLTLPYPGGTDQTTFLTTPDVTCGTGCGIVEAFEAALAQSWYYKCNITVGQVSNATYNREHDLGPTFRTLAAAAIALQGYGATNLSQSSIQYQVYPSDSIYGQPQGGYTDGMGSLIGEFAIGVVAAAALYSNQSNWYTIPGNQPQLGNQLTLSKSRWVFILLILGLLVGAQGLAFIVTAFWANKVLVKDESVFATATLLRPLLERLGDSGSAADGEAICRFLDDRPESRITYTAQKGVNSDVYHLEFGTHPPQRTFPEGSYD